MNIKDEKKVKSVSCSVQQSPDRYVSFVGLDCEGNARQVINMVLDLISDPKVTNKFWERFKAQVDAYDSGKGLGHDPLYLLHANVFYIRDLFEEQNATDAIKALNHLEETFF